MRRLREGRHVSLSPVERDGPARHAEVVAVYDRVAALRPAEEPAYERGGMPTEWFLVFAFERRTIALRGEVRTQSPTDLRFTASDGVVLSQRAAPRLVAELPFELWRAGTLAWEPIPTTTCNFSADGALVAQAGGIGLGDDVAFAFSPAPGLDVAGHATVVRAEGGRLALAFRGLAHPLRRQLVEHVIDAKFAASAPLATVRDR